MSAVEEAQKLLSRMTPGEKAQLLQRVAQESKDAYPGIDTIAGLCGGEPVIVRTRIPVWVLEQAGGLDRVKPICCVSIRGCTPKILRAPGRTCVLTATRSIDRFARTKAPRSQWRAYSLTRTFRSPSSKRRIGHNVITVADAGKAGQALSDKAVLEMAAADQRAVVTLNRRHFVQLHLADPNHARSVPELERTIRLRG
jgi:uncharacterized protein DUF5615